MKKWTVMVIPHGRGDRQTFEVGVRHALLGLALLGTIGLAVGYGPRADDTLATVEAAIGVAPQNVTPKPVDFQDVNLDTVEHETVAPEPAPSLPQSERAAIEARIRSEYATLDSKFTSELDRLYQLEAEVREITGLPPREESSVLAALPGGGQGGGPEEYSEEGAEIDPAAFRPPHIIQGLAQPSADLILLEMRLRLASMNDLMIAMVEQEDRVARIPSIPPTSDPKRSISSGFGNRIDPFTKRKRFHGGLDVAAVHGAPIQATARGMVTESGRDRFYGNYVKIDHGNGYETLFGHMSKRLANVGDIVERGTLIGKVGSTGRSTSAHIHYEVMQNGRRINPRKYIGQ